MINENLKRKSLKRMSQVVEGMMRAEYPDLIESRLQQACIQISPFHSSLIPYSNHYFWDFCSYQRILHNARDDRLKLIS